MHTGDQGEDDMDVTRRWFLECAMVVGALPWAARSPSARTFLRQVDIDGNLVDALTRATRQLMAGANSTSPMETLTKLDGLSVLCATSAAQAGALYTAELLQLAAQVEAMQGWVAQTAGQRQQAEARLEDADRTAINVGDPELRALTHVWWSDLHSTVQQGRGEPSPHIVLDHLHLAEELAGDEARAGLRAYINMRLAEEHAIAGPPATAMRYVQQAHDAWSTLQGGEGDLFGSTWSERLTYQFMGNVFLLCSADHTSYQADWKRQTASEARSILQGIVDSQPDSAHSDRIAALTDLAAAMARSGELEESTRLLGSAYTLALQSGREDRKQRVVGVLDRELSAWVDEPAVQRLQELVRF
jgi:hypothetical protein